MGPKWEVPDLPSASNKLSLAGLLDLAVKIHKPARYTPSLPPAVPPPPGQNQCPFERPPEHEWSKDPLLGTLRTQYMFNYHSDLSRQQEATMTSSVPGLTRSLWGPANLWPLVWTFLGVGVGVGVGVRNKQPRYYWFSEVLRLARHLFYQMRHCESAASHLDNTTFLSYTKSW